MMKVELIFILVLNVVFIWGAVNCSYPFEELANELRSKEAEHKAATNINDPNAVYKANAVAYASKFKTFLADFENSDNALPCEKYRKLDSEAWEGHYLIKVYLDVSARQDIALKNTKFQKIHEDLINAKNIDIIHNYIYFFLRGWSRNISDTKKANAVNKVSVNMDEVKDRYIEALLLLDESTGIKFKKYEVYLLYFYLKVKRIVQDSDFHTDQFLYDEFQKLVDKYVTEPNSISSVGYNSSSSRGSSPNTSRTSSPKTSPSTSPNNSPRVSSVSSSSSTMSSPNSKFSSSIRKKLTPRFMRKKTDITKYIDAKLKIIKKGMTMDKKFDEVATAFINLYYNVFEDAPDNFDVTKIHEQYLVFLKNYGELNEKKDIKYSMVTDGYTHLIRIFGEPKRKKSK